MSENTTTSTREQKQCSEIRCLNQERKYPIVMNTSIKITRNQRNKTDYFCLLWQPSV